MTNINEADRRPFMALIFTRLPNLSEMSAHVPAYDAFLGEVLKQALQDHHNKPPMQAFLKLKKLSVLCEWARPPGKALGYRTITISWA